MFNLSYKFMALSANFYFFPSIYPPPPPPPTPHPWQFSRVAFLFTNLERFIIWFCWWIGGGRETSKYIPRNYSLGNLCVPAYPYLIMSRNIAADSGGNWQPFCNMTHRPMKMFLRHTREQWKLVFPFSHSLWIDWVFFFFFSVGGKAWFLRCRILDFLLGTGKCVCR